MYIGRVLCGLVLAVLASRASAQTPLLNAVFQDHAVVQRDRPIEVWGHATPGADVTLTLGSAAVTAHADMYGDWNAKLPALPAGGPYVLQAMSNGEAQRVSDVLVGDVFLCSGQSNMALAVKHTLDADSEIADGTNDTIRMLTIEHVASPVPLTALAQTVRWEPAAPATVGDFSAACYYFARELQKTVHVAVGLVDASWGGAKIRAWMSERALRASGAFDPQLDIADLYARDPQTALGPFGAEWEAWWKRRVPSDEPWDPALDVRGWPQAPSLGFWDDWGVPLLVNYTGMVWYRTTVAVTAAQAAMPASLAIGKVDEIAYAWVNGKFVGAGSMDAQTYKLPPGTLHAGTNTVAVNIFNTYKKGGLIGPASEQALRFGDGTSVPLSEPWRYDIVPLSVGDPPRAPWEPLAGLSMAYNGMIAPLGPYSLRGVVWYQGESDTADAGVYKTLLSGLMQDWRRQFESDLPFLIVQLPNYGLPESKPSDSNWAKLRNAQRAAVAANGNSALIVTIDIGEGYDVHPPNKQELGRRLALAAQRLVYGRDVEASGPTAENATGFGNRVAVTFSGRGLVAYGADTPIGFELCDAKACRYAAAAISDGRILLSVPARFAPTHVRYCWADGPICTLFDRAGLPAAPFDLPIKPSLAQKAAPRKHASR